MAFLSICLEFFRDFLLRSITSALQKHCQDASKPNHVVIVKNNLSGIQSAANRQTKYGVTKIN